MHLLNMLSRSRFIDLVIIFVRAARDAVASRDGYEFERLRLRVEMAGEGRPHTHRRFVILMILYSFYKQG